VCAAERRLEKRKEWMGVATSARSFDVKEMKNIKIYFASMHAGFSERRGAWKLLRSAREEVTFAILIPYSFLKRFSSWCARVCASAIFYRRFSSTSAASGKLFPESGRAFLAFFYYCIAFLGPLFVMCLLANCAQRSRICALAERTKT
jgi:hypothetical protein